MALPQPSSVVPQNLPSSAHDLGLHSQFPPTQCWEELHFLPHAPQLSLSFVVLTHLLPQSVDSGVFEQPSTHVPSLQIGVLPVHALSHVPQWSAISDATHLSLQQIWVLSQPLPPQGSTHSPEALQTWPLGHTHAAEHSPLLQKAFVAQVWPQEPQLSASVLRSVQVSPQHVALGQPESQDPVGLMAEHRPLMQCSSAAHSMPQEPQFFVSASG